MSFLVFVLPPTSNCDKLPSDGTGSAQIVERMTVAGFSDTRRNGLR